MAPAAAGFLGEVTMYQPCPSSGQPVGPLRPPAPASVLTAVKLTYAGTAVFTVSLIISIISVAFVGRGAATLRLAGRSQPLPVVIAVGIVGGLVVIALWLWMARANSRGRNWARILSTALFGLATLKLIGAFSEPRTVLALIFWAPTWLIGLAAVWQLWRPDSSAFFKPQGAMPGLRGA
jgi:hypothetical protein